MGMAANRQGGRWCLENSSGHSGILLWRVRYEHNTETKQQLNGQIPGTSQIIFGRLSSSLVHMLDTTGLINLWPQIGNLWTLGATTNVATTLGYRSWKVNWWSLVDMKQRLERTNQPNNHIPFTLSVCEKLVQGSWYHINPNNALV